MKAVVFDLDDTLYNEEDYVYSAFAEIACDLEGRYNLSDVLNRMKSYYIDGIDVFKSINDYYGINIPIASYLEMYRNHFPSIDLSVQIEAVLVLLKERGVKLGLITDGRSITQRNKIKALGLNAYFPADCIVISEEFGSEKPDLRNYLFFQEKFGVGDFFYIGDNPQKDFYSPNFLHWTSICLINSGRNVHAQNFDIAADYLPQKTIKTIEELVNVIFN